MNEELNLAGMRCGNWTSTDTSFFYFKESLYLFSLYFVITATPIGLQGLLLALLFEINHSWWGIKLVSVAYKAYLTEINLYLSSK